MSLDLTTGCALCVWLSSALTIPPSHSKAWNYLRSSMFQTLPLLMGALYLLAESFIDPPPPPDDGASGAAQAASASTSAASTAERLHAHAYALYTDFRPETGGAWGKKAKVHLDTILDLRRGFVKSEPDDGALEEHAGAGQEAGGAGTQASAKEEEEDSFDRELEQVDWDAVEDSLAAGATAKKEGEDTTAEQPPTSTAHEP